MPMKAADFETELGESVQNLRRVLPLMSKERVPTTPANYALWYDYVTRRNDDLCREMEEHLRGGQGISAAVSKELFDKHFGGAEERAETEKLRLALNELVGNVVGQLGGMGVNVSRFSDFLGSTGERLGADINASELRTVVAELINETRVMKERNRDVEASLNAISTEIGELRTEVQRLNRDSTTDALTQIPNRRAFDTGMVTMAGDAQRNAQPLTLAIIDIDNFKAFNDSYGHLVGDQVIRFVARELSGCTKGKDLAARYGGEEFAILLPNTALEGAYALTDGIRKLIEGQSQVEASFGAEVRGVTVSAGVALYRPGETTDSFIARADQCLYASKSRGRNRVTTETGLEVH